MKGLGRRLFGGPPTRLQRSLSVVALASLAVTIGVPLADGQRPERPVLRWSSQLKPLALFIERERGLRFREVVALRTLPAVQFDRVAAKDPTPGLAVVTVRALDQVGIVAAEDGQNNNTVVMARAAHFDPATNTIGVRSGAARDRLRASLVDALTDALHHQSFDLSQSPPIATERGAAWQALRIGDRTRVVEAYRRSEQARAGDRTTESGPSDAFTLVASAHEGFAKGWGAAMVQQTFDRGGNAAVNALFVDPPISRADVLRRAFGDAAERPLTVRNDSLDVGLDDSASEIGAVGWFALSARTSTFDQALASARSLLGEQTRIDPATGCVRATVEVTAQTPWKAGARWREIGPHSIGELDSCADLALDFARSDGIDALKAFTALPHVAMDVARRRDRSVAWGLCVALATATSNGPSALVGDVVVEPTQTPTGRATCDERAEFSVALPTAAPQSA